MTTYLIVKLFHLFFVISWMAGVFYLPRILVHFKVALHQSEPTERLSTMARKLYHFSMINLVGTVASGLSLAYFWFDFSSFWVYAKLTVVALLVVYFLITGQAVHKMQKTTPVFGSERFWRFFNEIPVVLLLIILYFVLFKPL